MYKISYQINVLSNKEQLVLYLFIALWLISESMFWFWWLNPIHIITKTGFIINSVIVFWNSLMTIYFFYFLMRMKKPNPEIAIPKNWRVAMVVTKAPSEPFEIVKKTLVAMKNQSISHDNWLADEDPTEEVIRWCKENNVFISTRKNDQNYQRDQWPRRARCKEGNLAYFYDHYGYNSYDFVSQLDADHIPTANYLEAVLRPFIDPEVGYVSAPSICNNNAKISWSARGRLFAEATLHGPLQSGYSNGWAPLCIGSHYAVRTKALKQIGGLGPELAEDHSTTLIMQANGWKGVHGLDAIAYGDGPATFADAMTQEFQWSRSLFVILLTITPKYILKLPFKLILQFLFAQIWYPMFVLYMFSAILLPIIALLVANPWLEISYIQYLIFSAVPTSFALLVLWYVRKLQIFRPINSPLISWEVIFFQFARWPWVFWAIVMAVISLTRRKYIEFKITPKGSKPSPKISLSILLPYFMIVLVLTLIIFLSPKKELTYGYFYFVLFNATIYFLLLLFVTIFHIKESNISNE